MIYIASPYSHDDPRIREQRYKYALAYLTALTKNGRLAYSPIVHGHHVNILLGNTCPGWDFWKRHDSRMMLHCSELHVLCIPGWEESVGVNEEIRIARFKVTLISMEELCNAMLSLF